MAIHFYYDEKENILWITLSKVVSAKDVQDCNHYMETNTRIKPGYIEVVDFEDVTNLKFNYNNIRIVTNTRAKLKKQKGWAGSIEYASSNLSYGMARMASAISEVKGIGEVIIVKKKEQIAESIQKIKKKT